MTYFETKKSIKEALLPVCGEYAGYEAEKILIEIYKTDKKSLSLMYTSEAPDKSELTEKIISARKNGEPLAYILGKTDFFGLTLEVNPSCLVPRADTEVICEKALDFLKDKKSARVLDVCTGSGCIALAIAANSDSFIDALDISESALSTAKKNSESLGLDKKTDFFVCDVFSDELLKRGKKYDLIISNPPYIPTKDIAELSDEVKHEPIAALDGGDDGLLFYRRLTDILPRLLSPDGEIIFEIGFNEKAALSSLLSFHRYKYSFFDDYGRNVRGVTVKP